MSTKTVIAAATICLTALFASDQASLMKPDTWVCSAEARRGRPATPTSYAGVARRTTRRTVGATTAVATTRTCRTVYNTYGQAVTTCY
jgi:hypothetical protein